jgi:hypothetical protein
MGVYEETTWSMQLTASGQRSHRESRRISTVKSRYQEMTGEDID